MNVVGGSDAGPDPLGVAFHPCEVTVVERSEGYREFRCIPATWSYPGDQRFTAYMTELCSSERGTDPHGIGTGADFWSGSDAAMRLRRIPVDDLALREIAALASRRLLGLNAPRPWVSEQEIHGLVEAWQPDAGYSDDEGPTSLWAGYGMEESSDEPVIFGWGMRASDYVPPLPGAGPQDNAPGTWYAWSTVLDWDRWPRRQEAKHLAADPGPGRLLLFVSHRWESLSHPDPRGAQLLALKVGLDLALAAAILRADHADSAERTTSGLPELMADFLRQSRPTPTLTDPHVEAWARNVREAAQATEVEEDYRSAVADIETGAVRPALDEIRHRVLVWYDHASMFQVPRSTDEEAAFRREILELNSIQRGAATLVIAGDSQYESRAWCFLELCGGIRQRIVELVPSWGGRLGVGASATRWASRSDQLISALVSFGPAAMGHSGVEATHPEDLPDIAHLLSGLPVIGRTETDDSDLVGGALPLPRRAGRWLLPTSRRDIAASEERSIATLPELGRLPLPAVLRRAAEQYAGADGIDGAAGMWVYTTQRTLTLAWASRAAEIWATLQRDLAGSDNLAPLIETGAPAVACLWADARALADDGAGWTRAVPSTVPLLVVVTQADIPKICWIYDMVVRAHVAAGTTVVAYMPDTGGVLAYRAGGPDDPTPDARQADVLAVPRLRRSDVRASNLFMAYGTQREDVEVLAALRLDPADGFVPPGRMSADAAVEGIGMPGEEITPTKLLTFSEARARAEALARGTAATWDSWCRPRLGQGAWAVGMAALQLHLIEQLVRKAYTISEDPFRRRKLLDILVADEEGYALPPSILDEADTLIELIRQREGDPP